MTAENGFHRYLTISWCGSIKRNAVVFNHNSDAVKFSNLLSVAIVMNTTAAIRGHSGIQDVNLADASVFHVESQ